MESKRVTCLITSYMKFEYIFSAIDGVLKQNYPDIELIICDDCSSNFPKDEIENYVDANKKDNIKRVLIYSNKENLGTVKNFNTALKNATGYYFLNTAADDEFFDENVFANVVKQFEKTGAHTATCRIAMRGSRGLDGNCLQLESDIDKIKNYSPEKLYNTIVTDNIICGGAHYFTRDMLEKFGYFNENYRYIEDLPHFLTLLRNGEKICFFDIVSVWYRVDGISRSNSVPVRYLEDNLAICENEILPYRESMSLLSYRYNLCRRKTIQYRIEGTGKLALTKKIELFLTFPDAALLNIIINYKRRHGRRKCLI